MRPALGAALLGLLLAACGSFPCGPVPKTPSFAACPATDCITQCSADRASCVEVCTAGGCWECSQGTWQKRAMDCPSSCR
jgi:hypothetical protein